MRTSLRKNQDGIAHLLIIVLVVVVLAAIGFAAWWVFMKNDKPDVLKNASPEVTATQSACMSQYNDEDLCTFIAVQTASPFDEAATVITMNSTSEGSTSTIIIESDGQGNSKTSMTGDGQVYNYITLNDISYYQTEADGPWISYGADSTDAAAGADESATSSESGLNDFMSSLSTTTYTKIGQEACGNLTCLKYQVIDTEQAGSTLFAWFDTEDYLLRQFSLADASGSWTMTIAYQAVTIPTPSPVQDYSDMYDDFSDYEF